MFKKTILLATIAGFSLSTAAFAVETNQKDLQKANQSSTQMKQEQKAAPAKPATTGSGSTSADPRDSNATQKPMEKSKTDDANQKQGQ